MISLCQRVEHSAIAEGQLSVQGARRSSWEALPWQRRGLRPSMILPGPCYRLSVLGRGEEDQRGGIWWAQLLMLPQAESELKSGWSALRGFSFH